MFITALVALSLSGPVTLANSPTFGDLAPPNLTLAQKQTLVQARVEDANACFVRAFTEHRLKPATSQTELYQQIMLIVPQCIAPSFLLMRAYDQYFGQGTGEIYFSGPFLDGLIKSLTSTK